MTPTTLKPLELLRREITYDDAIEEEENILQESTYPQQRLDLYVYFIRHKIELRAIVSRHLGLTGSDTCRVADVQEWLQGSFNFCIPVYINNWSKFSRKRVLLRFPLPYKVGESHFPGNADEKLRCEASTYVWIQENCADVPVPYLWGFGFSNGQSVCNKKDCLEFQIC